LGELPPASQSTKRKAAISLVIAAAGAIFSAFDLHGWHIYVGLGLTMVAAVYGLMRWKQKYPQT
jgi:hypothetical protein